MIFGRFHASGLDLARRYHDKLGLGQNERPLSGD
jgi:hypothetical protein